MRTEHENSTLFSEKKIVCEAHKSPSDNYSCHRWNNRTVSQFCWLFFKLKTSRSRVLLLCQLHRRHNAHPCCWNCALARPSGHPALVGHGLRVVRSTNTQQGSVLHIQSQTPPAPPPCPSTPKLETLTLFVPTKWYYKFRNKCMLQAFDFSAWPQHVVSWTKTVTALSWKP